jgi:hypothetical protein
MTRIVQNSCTYLVASSIYSLIYATYAQYWNLLCTYNTKVGCIKIWENQNRFSFINYRKKHINLSQMAHLKYTDLTQ